MKKKLTGAFVTVIKPEDSRDYIIRLLHNQQRLTYQKELEIEELKKEIIALGRKAIKVRQRKASYMNPEILHKALNILELERKIEKASTSEGFDNNGKLVYKVQYYRLKGTKLFINRFFRQLSKTLEPIETSWQPNWNAINSLINHEGNPIQDSKQKTFSPKEKNYIKHLVKKVLE